MGYCIKCGTELAEDNMFCTKCGHPVKKEGADANFININASANVQTPAAPKTKEKPDKRNKSHKGLITALIILGVLIILLFVLSLTFVGIYFAKSKGLFGSGNVIESIGEMVDLGKDKEDNLNNTTNDAGNNTSENVQMFNPSEYHIGISMPTDELDVYKKRGTDLEKELLDKGYNVDLQFASNSIETQNSQIKEMIASDYDALVIMAIAGDELTDTLEEAKNKGIPVISYDRLIMDSSAVSYYVSFDFYDLGQKQGQYIEESLGLKDGNGPYNIEIFTGDPGDAATGNLYNGAMAVLKPYIESGQLNVPSGQISLDEVTTVNWDTATANSRMNSILENYYSDGKLLDAVLCSNDSVALGVIDSLADNYRNLYPIITGFGCDKGNVKNIISAKQSMSLFCGSKEMSSQATGLIDGILQEKVSVSGDSIDNGQISVPVVYCEPTVVDFSNYEKELIDSGFYTSDQLAFEDAIEYKPINMELTVSFGEGYKEVNCLFVYVYENGRAQAAYQYDYDSNLLNSAPFEYDENGNRTRDWDFGASLDGISMVSVSKQYDEKNYLIKTFHDSYYEAYENDSDGNPIHVDYYYDDFDNPGNYVLYMTDDSTFDGMGREITRHRENLYGKWTDNYTFYYNSIDPNPDYCLEAYDDELEYDDWTTTYTYKYDSDGRIIEEVTCIRDKNDNITDFIKKKFNY